MYEIPQDRSPELMLNNHEVKDLNDLLDFRLRCKRENKMGMISKGFGRMLWIDRDGSLMDQIDRDEFDKTISKLKELGEL
jgi:hypothetical protein